MRECVAAGEGFAPCDEAFHSDLLAVTSNHMMQQLGMAFWRIHTAAVPAAGLPQARDISDTVNAHDAIIDALVAGDPAAYREAVVEHYRPLRRLLEVAAD